jgi:hypothetical protein
VGRAVLRSPPQNSATLAQLVERLIRNRIKPLCGGNGRIEINKIQSFYSRSFPPVPAESSTKPSTKNKLVGALVALGRPCFAPSGNADLPGI